jgi:hypothetical protein
MAIKPVKDKEYWVATLFRYEYSQETKEGYKVLAGRLPDQEAWIMKAICVESDTESPSWSPNADHSYALMYFLKLEEDGMPFEENRFLVACWAIFEDRNLAQQCADELLEKYLAQEAKERLKIATSIFTLINAVSGGNIIDITKSLWKCFSSG